ncbi:MAG: mannose-1-phosphate guanylyltransferase [Myxococcota bacterium]
MAGGSGTRFWPASRKRRPKQFLTIGGSESLLKQTVRRALEIVDPAHLFIVTAELHAEHARQEVPELPAENILVEPVGRNTAPCIGWATRRIRAVDPEAIVAVLPADHYIADRELFVRHLKAAMDAAEAGKIVLLGLVPTRPETGYGYIQRGAEVHRGSFPVHRVERFVEKPDLNTALAYLAAGTYLWNSGMFVFRAGVMDQEIRLRVPELAAGLDRIAAAPAEVPAIYPTLPSISIDYAVMEKAEDVWVLPASFPWSDVGSWDAAFENAAKDEEANVLFGDAVVVDVRRSYVDARSGRVVAAVGIDDVIIVDTKDALLVTRQGRSQDVRHIVDALTRAGRKDLL